jgi:hypothetical protein
MPDPSNSSQWYTVSGINPDKGKIPEAVSCNYAPESAGKSPDYATLPKGIHPIHQGSNRRKSTIFACKVHFSIIQRTPT